MNSSPLSQLECILLIDDDPVTNFLNQSLIEELRITRQVVVCKNGAEGLKVLQQGCQNGQPPELILVDVHMPVMDGFVFLEHYQKAGYHQSFPSIVVMLTSSTNSRDIVRAKTSGIAQYLAKPLVDEHLQQLSAQVLARRRSRIPEK